MGGVLHGIIIAHLRANPLVLNLETAILGIYISIYDVKYKFELVSR